jgi:hypothetical protein
MWVSKPIYESLPYFYLLVGTLSLAASMYVLVLADDLLRHGCGLPGCRAGRIAETA